MDNIKDNSADAQASDRGRNQACNQAQAQAIADFISGGIEHGCGSCVGLEIEHFIVTRNSHEYVAYLDDQASGRPGVQSVLQRLAPCYDGRIFEDQADGSRALIGLTRLKANVTLEPGAQFEISIGPAVRLSTLQQLYTTFRAELDPILEEFGYELLTLGYHPSICAFEAPLLPKQRYRYMDQRFEEVGKHGICMMRGTASTQVSIDFASEEDALRKYRMATILGPLLSFITDNTPVFEGVRIGSDEPTRSGLPVPKRMARTAIWNDVDPSRQNTAPHTFDEGFGFADYGASLLAAPAIFSVEYDDDLRKRTIYQGAKPFSEVYRGQALDLEKVEHILSLFFFDVRFKTYIEIRMADSLPPDFAFSFAALIKGLFYLPETVEKYAKLAAALGADDVAAAKAALMKDGFAALVYGRAASEWLDELIVAAARGLDLDEQLFLEPLAQLIRERRTLIDGADA
jgi:glutamate--cysteine ligase